MDGTSLSRADMKSSSSTTMLVWSTVSPATIREKEHFEKPLGEMVRGALYES